ncbi:uncharacterized protein ASPGLDRAFT_182657 [Aspergillus glaucus CBS 516.65]|uniref:Uncharacterized protein n=1 Tax=Aspergillus glaucus CBS 516.65 TaxID=1160497 RepID=A0A1L9V3F9_ASPGL|nr:hypothetical protein ASPGLDRAFT_182657 [Aspergillus glaucus CBS 516.65]OJJ78431.1 hypothetical protein ASPGLDRAFT_182657 [Aspergillus glaucus CBS 516.65]
MTEVVEVSTVLPEYPQSHVSGYTYIIPCNPQKPLDYRGIMRGLKNLHHTKVTEETWGRIQEVRRLIEMAGDDERKRNALGIYIGENRLFKQKKACRVPNTTCKPVFGWSIEPNIAGIYHPYICCIHRKPLQAHIQPDHYFKSLSFRTDTDLVLLGQYFNQAVQPDLTQCGAIESTGSRKAECKDIQKCPYFLFTSHGIHTHPPPPPTKTPLDILEELRRIIQDIKDPDMTTGSFLCNPRIIEYCNERNAESLSGLHATLVTQDRIKSLIDKEKIALFPKGQEVNGLIFQCQREPKLREYVQHTFQDNENTLIILAHQAQFKLLQSLKMFEVDMNYKRLRRKDLNEIVFAAFLPLHGKVVTLCRAFTNRQDADGYEDLFQKVFELMEKHTNQPICFHYLHGSGFESITLDMDEGQMLGLGQYLSSIDPERRPARWHIPHIMITCRVHFFRGIEKAIGQRKRGTTAFQTMASLLNCETQLDYYEIIQLLQGYEDEAIMHWASHKADPLIAAGLNKTCSSMDSSFFDNARMHTNAGEQSHNKIYVFGGTWLSILKAAQCARICDARDIDQYNARQDLGIQHSYQSDSIPSRHSRKSLQEGKYGNSLLVYN